MSLVIKSEISSIDEFREKYQGIAKDAARISALDKKTEEFKTNKEKVRELFQKVKEGETKLSEVMSSVGKIITPQFESTLILVAPGLRNLDAVELENISTNQQEHVLLDDQIEKIQEFLFKICSDVTRHSVSSEELKTVKEEASDCKKRLEELATSLALSTIRADLETLSSSDLTQLSSEDKQMIETISSLRECEGISGFLAINHPSLQIKAKKQVQFSEEPATVSYFEYEKSPVVVTREEQNRPRNARPVTPRGPVVWSATQFSANLKAMLFSGLEPKNSGVDESNPKRRRVET